MDNSKRETIKDGKNIDFDGGQVINEGISLGEQKKQEEETPIIPEVPAIETATADASAEEPVSEVPVIPVETAATPEIDIPAYDPSISFAAPGDAIPVPNPIELPTSIDVPAFPEVNAIETPEQPQFGGFNAFEYPQNNFSNNVIQGDFGSRTEIQGEVPAGVETALGMVKNEVLELVRENKKLEQANKVLQNENVELHAQASECQSKIRLLEQDKRDLQSSMSKAQNQILNVFGMNGMNNAQLGGYTQEEDYSKDRNMTA